MVSREKAVFTNRDRGEDLCNALYKSEDIGYNKRYESCKIGFER